LLSILTGFKIATIVYTLFSVSMIGWLENYFVTATVLIYCTSLI